MSRRWKGAIGLRARTRLPCRTGRRPTLARVSSRAARRPPPRRAQAVRRRVELPLNDHAEGEHDGDNDRSDPRKEQAVLDGGRTAVRGAG